jgi:hypothetical protein
MPGTTEVLLSEVDGNSFTLRDTIFENNQKESIFYLTSLNLARDKTYYLKISVPDLPSQAAYVCVIKNRFLVPIV